MGKVGLKKKKINFYPRTWRAILIFTMNSNLIKSNLKFNHVLEFLLYVQFFAKFAH